MLKSFLSRFGTARYFRNALHFIGAESHSTSHLERLLSTLGAFLGIAATLLVASHYSTEPQLPSSLLIASMGASAVLLFAVPHGALSQPWPVIGGHALSATIAYACLLWLPQSIWLIPLSVGLSVGVMYYLRCIHPPGGATALATILNGDIVLQIGPEYLFFPILVNAACIVVVAMAFNAPFHWRRYPAALSVASRKNTNSESLTRHVTHEDFAHAIQSLDSFVDVTPDDLAVLFDYAIAHAQSSASHPQLVRLGACYSNGELGAARSIRQVIDMSERGRRRRRSKVIYKVVADNDSYNTGVCDEEEFRLWARSEVQLIDGHWVRSPNAETSPGLV